MDEFFGAIDAPILRSILALPEMTAMCAELSGFGAACATEAEDGIVDVLMAIRLGLPVMTPKLLRLLSAIISSQVTGSAVNDSPFVSAVIELGEGVLKTFLHSIEGELIACVDALISLVKDGSLRTKASECFKRIASAS